MGDRYFVFEIADYYSDNFAYVGKRTTGSKAESFAILPPGWKGDLPADVTKSFESPTPDVLIFGCTLAKLKFTRDLQAEVLMRLPDVASALA